MMVMTARKMVRHADLQHHVSVIFINFSHAACPPLFGLPNLI